jgi:RNase P subunit RPR2
MTKEWRKKYPNKAKLQHKTRVAYREGKIKKTPCVICKTNGEPGNKLLMHHVDYEDALHVIWLCENCHTKLHNKK